MSERSLAAVQQVQSAQQRFDYFMTGLTGALCAYITQAFTPERLALSPNTMELASFFVLVVAFLTGLKRIGAWTQAIRFTALMYAAQDRRGQLASLPGSTAVNDSTGLFYTPEEVRTLMEKEDVVILKSKEEFGLAAKRSARWSYARDAFLALGFMMLVGAKVWAAYAS